MFKKHIIFQILYIIVGPLSPASLKRFRQAQSALIGQLTKCIVIGRTPQHPFHYRELKLKLVYHQFKPERGTESRDRHSDDARKYLENTSRG